MGHLLYSEDGNFFTLNSNGYKVNLESKQRNKMLANINQLENELRKITSDNYNVIEKTLEKFIVDKKINESKATTIGCETEKEINVFVEKLNGLLSTTSTFELEEMVKSFYPNDNISITENELALFRSVQNGNVKKFKSIFSTDKSINMNAKFESHTLFLWSVYHEKLEMVEFLFENFDVDFKETDEFSRNVFQIAILINNGEKIISLLSKYQHKYLQHHENCPIVNYFLDNSSIDLETIDLYYQDNYSATPLHYIAATGNMKALNCIKHRLDSFDYKMRDCRNRTCFELASMNGRLKMLEELVNIFKIEMDYSNQIVKSILKTSLWSCHIDIVEWWFSNVKSIPCNIVDENNLFHHAFSSDSKKYVKVINFLEAKGGDIRKRNKHGNTVIEERLGRLSLLFNFKKETINFLVDKGVEIRCKNKKNQYITHLAAMYGTDDVLEAAYNHQVPITEQDDNGYTPLMYAASKGWFHMIICILDLDSSYHYLHKTDQYGLNAANIAMNNGYEKIVKYLISNGLLPNEPNFNIPSSVILKAKDNMYFQHHHASYFDRSIEDLMKKVKLDILMDTKFIRHLSKYEDPFGIGLVHLCAIYGRNDIILWCFMNKLSLDKSDIYGTSALYYALMHNKLNTALLLIALGVKHLYTTSNCNLLSKHFREFSIMCGTKTEEIILKFYNGIKLLNKTCGKN